jgi:hypothetical protein
MSERPDPTYALVEDLIERAPLVLGAHLGVSEAAAAMTETPEGTAPVRPAGYGAIAASNGIASLLLVVVVILMIWKP